jgi:hypothetical protein
MNQQQQDNNNWAQWLVGGANAAPAAQDMPLPHFDLNQAAPGDAHQPMDFDLNDDLGLDGDPDLEMMIPAIGAKEGIEQEQVSVSVSAGNFNDSDSSIQEGQSEVVNDSLSETNVSIDNAGALVFFHDQQLQNNPDGQGFHLPVDLLQIIDQPALSPGHQPSNLNLQIGFMTQQDCGMADPVFERFSVQMETQPLKSRSADLFRLWGNHFSPVGNPRRRLIFLYNVYSKNTRAGGWQGIAKAGHK